MTPSHPGSPVIRLLAAVTGLLLLIIVARAQGPGTPKYAQFRTRAQFGALWTFGLKGSF